MKFLYLFILYFILCGRSYAVQCVSFPAGTPVPCIAASGGVINLTPNVGIGTSAPAATLEVDGTFYLNATPSQTYWKSPSGLCWILTVDDTGNLNINATSCPTAGTPVGQLQFLGNNLQFLGSNLTFNP